MQINVEYAIDALVNTDEWGSKVLKQVLVERLDGAKGIAVATDGRAIAVVPVELAPEDVPGTVPPEAFRAARKQAKRGVCVLMLQEHTVSTSDGERFTRTLEQWPDWRRYVPPSKPTNANPPASIVLCPRVLAKIGRAMGNARLRFTFGPAALGAIRVDTDQWNDPTYGAIMPAGV